MNVFIAVLFYVNGSMTIVDGFDPILQPNMETCMERKAKVDEYFEYQREIGQLAYPTYVFCSELDNFDQAQQDAKEYFESLDE